MSNFPGANELIPILFVLWQKRYVLEESNQLEPRISGLDDEMDIESEEEEDVDEMRVICRG